MKFKTVAQTFSKIESIDSRNDITAELAQLLRQTTPQEAAIIMYLAQGSLQPVYKAHQFSFGQKNMIKTLAHLFNKSVDEIQHEVDRLGDVGSLFNIYEWPYDGQLEIQEVYDRLVEFEAISGTGSQDQKNIFFQMLLKDVDSLSAMYIVRVVLGLLRLGFSDMTLLDALSWMIMGNKVFKPYLEDAYNRCADLGLIAYTLKADGIENIKKIAIQVGIPIRPAAADRLADVPAIFAKLGPCVAQPKLDGFRVQVHYDRASGLVKFFSRNLLDMSDMFPELVVAVPDLLVDSCIIEGEAIVFDHNTQQFLPFQDTVKRKRKHGIDAMAADYPLRLYLFDLLYLNGSSTLELTHTQRRNLLMSVQEKKPLDTIVVIDERMITTEADLQHYFLEALAEGLEGIVVKKTDAIYQPGKRNSNWIKLKYHADQKLEDTIDVVILGYYPGHGRRAQFQIGAFLVGVYNQEKDVYETIAKVGTGMDDAGWHELKAKCDNFAVADQPKNVVCHKNLAPKVWIKPVIVCEVLADEITISPAHTAGKTEDNLGMALRFPRFVKYRPDKNAEQTTSVQELAGMIKKLS